MKQVRVTIKIDLEIEEDSKGRIDQEVLKQQVYNHLEEQMDEESLELSTKVTDDEDDEDLSVEEDW